VIGGWSTDIYFWLTLPNGAKLTPAEESKYDKHCRREDDPCAALKAAADQAIDMARRKMNNMLNDKTLYGTGGWTRHGNELGDRIASI
jgi:hypothetical protein